jgi:hypothetical protein
MTVACPDGIQRETILRTLIALKDTYAILCDRLEVAPKTGQGTRAMTMKSL